ncbi:MAG TPA: mercuric reductase [Herpetosiphonaceae bacterium]
MYDLVVIGGGSAGVTFAKFGPRLGARVAIIEAHKLGGDCTWTGCVPSKTLIHAAKAAHTVRTAGRYGIRPQSVEIDFAAVMRHVRSVQEEIYEHDDSPEVLRRAGAEIIEGRARFVAEDAVEVNGRTIRAKHFCIATGSHPAAPPIDGLAEAGYLTNESVFLIDELPKRLLVIGGGPIGCELGQSFARLGAQVTIVQRAGRLLDRDDAELGPALQACLEAEGIAVRLNAEVRRVRRGPGGKLATIALAGGGESELEVDEILVAAGRVPNLKELGLDTAGVLYDAGKGVTVDAYLRTSNPRIFACGDVIGRYQFTHMAGAEAGLVMRNAFFPLQSKMGYGLVPWATFTDPEVAHAGLNEDEARARYGKQLKVFRLPWTNNDRARTESDTAGFAKLLTVGRKNKLVGAHIIGAGAGDLIHELVAVMQAGLGLSAVSGPIHVYPTRSIGVRNAAQQALTGFLDHPLGQRLLRGYFKLFGA